MRSARNAISATMIKTGEGITGMGMAGTSNARSVVTILGSF